MTRHLRAGLAGLLLLLGAACGGESLEISQTFQVPLPVSLGGSGAATITGLVVGNGTSAYTAYGGATCTNQFIRSLSAAGAATCASVSSADVSLTTTTCTNQFVSAIAANGTGTCTTDTLAGAQHANQGTTTTVLHGNASGNPSWGAVSLTADVSGTLPLANGGTGTTDPIIPGDFVLIEEFPGNTGTSVSIGTHGWRINNIGAAPTLAYQAGTQPNIGVLRITTTTTNGQGGNVELGGANAGMLPNLTTLPGTFDVYIRLALVQTTETRLRVGMMTAGTAAAQPTNGIFLRYDTSAGFADTNFMLCRRASSDTEACVATGTAADTSFHTFRLYTTTANATTWNLTVDGGSAVCMTTAGAGCGLNSTTFPTANLSLDNVIVTDTSVAAAKSVDVDYWGLRLKGLSR
jgi:hypothetical protein